MVQNLDHVLFIAISSRSQIITSFDDFLIGWGQFSWAKLRPVNLSGFTSLSFFLRHQRWPISKYTSFSLNFLSSRTPLLELICWSKKVLSKLISIEQFTTSQNIWWGFLEQRCEDIPYSLWGIVKVFEHTVCYIPHIITIKTLWNKDKEYSFKRWQEVFRDNFYSW